MRLPEITAYEKAYLRTRQNYSKVRALKGGVWCRESKTRGRDRRQVVKDFVNHMGELELTPRAMRSL